MFLQITLGVDDNNFAAGALTGVDAQRNLLPHRRSQKQLAEVGGKDFNRLFIRLFLHFLTQFRFQ